MSEQNIIQVRVNMSLLQPAVYQFKDLPVVDEVDWSKESWVSLKEASYIVSDRLHPYGSAKGFLMDMHLITRFVTATEKKKLAWFTRSSWIGEESIIFHSDQARLGDIPFQTGTPALWLPLWWYERVAELAQRRVYKVMRTSDGWEAWQTNGEKILMNEDGSSLAGPNQGVVRVQASASAASSNFDAEPIELTDYEIPVKAFSVVPKQIARDYAVVPVDLVERKLVLAIDDPSDLDARDILMHFFAHYELTFRSAPAYQIRALLVKYYLHSPTSESGSLRKRNREALGPDMQPA